MLRTARITTAIGRVLQSARAFKKEERGSVTIQVIFFSLMVFGATGVVLDAGRVYDTHSRLQIFADNMAHLAANELDRKGDSITRATNAVFAAASDGSALLTDGDANAGVFKVEKLEFFSDMAASESVQNDMSEAFPAGYNVANVTDTSTDATAESSVEAAFVVVTVSIDVSAVTRIVTQTIPNIGYDHPVNADSTTKQKSIGPASYDLQVKSAATLERESCATLSTLVMCNPWEDQTGAANALSVPKPAEGETNSNYTIPGRSLMYFAPNFQNGLVPDDRIVQNGEDIGSLFPWDINHQLFQIDNPVADPAGVCAGDFLLNLAGEVVSGGVTSQEYIEARDRCLMARSQAAQVCWSDEDPLTVRPANGDTVLRSINTIFDIWNEPFDTMIQNPTLLNASQPFTAADYFQPDRLATTTYETADRFGLPDASLPATCQGPANPEFDPTQDVGPDNLPLLFVDDPRLVQDGTPDYNLAWPCDNPNTVADESDPANASPDSFQPAYDTIPKPGWTYLAGTRGEGIGYDFCHDKTLGRQDTARQTRQLCLIEAEGSDSPIDAAAQCETDYVAATNFDTCAASAAPGRANVECGCEIDFVGDHHEGGQGIYMFARTQGYRNSLYDWASSALNPNTEFPVSFSGPMTWNAFYNAQRDLQENHPDVQLQGHRSRVAQWNGAPQVNSTDPQDAIADYGIPEATGSEHSAANEGYQKHFPDDFFALTGGVPSNDPAFNLATALPDGQARRRIISAMVNCSVVTGQVEDEDGFNRQANADGTYNVTVDDMKVMQAYVPNPAGMFCGPDTVECEIDQSIETSMYLELVNDITDEVVTDQYTVRLVR